MRNQELSEGLRQMMDSVELNGRQAAQVLGWSESLGVANTVRQAGKQCVGCRGVPRGVPG